MDVSGALHVLLREYETSKGLFFENHVYGCISLLEQWIEGSLDLSGSQMTFRDGTTPSFDIQEKWNDIGGSHGFYRPLIRDAPYEGSPEYKAFWSTLFQGPPLSEQGLDDFEEAVWKAYKETGALYFCGALATGDLSPELLEQGLAALGSDAAVVPVVPVVSAKRRRRKTRNAPETRILTPIKTHRRFALTRKGPPKDAPPSS